MNFEWVSEAADARWTHRNKFRTGLATPEVHAWWALVKTCEEANSVHYYDRKCALSCRSANTVRFFGECHKYSVGFPFVVFHCVLDWARHDYSTVAFYVGGVLVPQVVKPGRRYSCNFREHARYFPFGYTQLAIPIR